MPLRAFVDNVLTAANRVDAAWLNTVDVLLFTVFGTPTSKQLARAALSSDLTPAANKLQYWTGAAADALTDFTAFGRSLVDDANAAAALVTLGIGSPITAALGGDVTLNNTATYFDGPSVAQGSTGTWFVSGTVTMLDTAGAATFLGKLHDGTTVIASGPATSISASALVTISLSGFIVGPVGNLRISLRDTTSTSGVMKFNSSSLSKDSVITAFRLA